MKRMCNLTTGACDLDRFESRETLLDFLGPLDGVELMVYEEDARGIVPPEKVVGVHLGYFPFWLDQWNGDEGAVLAELGSAAQRDAYYGGPGREGILHAFRRDLDAAARYDAEYVVLHTSHAAIAETFTLSYRHTDEEVIGGLCELINTLFDGVTDGPLLLLENLWQPGLTFTRPEITRRLLEGMRYPKVGFLLDTGHLLHTNLDLTTQEEGLAYIHRMLDAHGELCRFIRGIHLNQSLTGAYCRRVMEDPPVLAEDYGERCGQMFRHAFAVDQHLPFTCPGVAQLVERLAPDYLTFEFITESLAQHRQFLDRQWAALYSQTTRKSAKFGG